MRILFLLLSFFYLPTTALAEDGSSTRLMLIAKVNQFNAAIKEGDKEKYADVFIEDMLFTWSNNGQLYSLESILPNVQPTPDFNPIVDEYRFRNFGNSAILNFRSRSSETEIGTRVTLSFVLIDGKWKVAALQSTKIIPFETD